MAYKSVYFHILTVASVPIVCVEQVFLPDRCMKGLSDFFIFLFFMLAATEAIVGENFEVCAQPCGKRNGCAHTVLAFVASFLPCSVEHDVALCPSPCLPLHARQRCVNNTTAWNSSFGYSYFDNLLLCESCLDMASHLN